MAYFNVNAYPAVDLVTPWVTMGSVVGEYGVDDNDQIISGATAPRFTPLAPGNLPKIIFDHDIMFDAHNPICRWPLENPFSNELFIVSNRHIMRAILNCFLFAPPPYLNYDAHRDICPFEVHRIGDRITFGSLSQRIGPKDYSDDDSRKGYGITFEKMITTAQPNQRAYYRFNAFKLLNCVNLVVRAEIDAVDAHGHYYEVKTRRHHNPKYSPLEDAVLMRDYWGQMFLGLAHSLVLGRYIDLVDQQEAELLGVDVLSAEEVLQIAEVHGLSLQRFATLLRWVQGNMRDGDSKLMAYSVASGLFSLYPNPSDEAHKHRGEQQQQQREEGKVDSTEKGARKEGSDGTTGTTSPSPEAANVLFGRVSSFSSFGSADWISGCD